MAPLEYNTSSCEEFGAVPLTAQRDAPEHLQRIVNVISLPGECRELRVISQKDRFGRLVGYFRDSKRLVQVATRYARFDQVLADALYITPNPVDIRLHARAIDRLKIGAKEATADTDILCRRFWFLDVDPVRPPGISATDDELQAALSLADQVLAVLNEVFDIRPQLAGSSGNGGFAWFPVDLPNDDDSTALVKAVLTSLAAMFTTSEVKIDTSVSNAARVMKLPGTVAAKGDHLVGHDQPDRPWRYSWATIIDPSAPVATTAQLRDVAEAGR